MEEQRSRGRLPRACSEERGGILVDIRSLGNLQAAEPFCARRAGLEGGASQALSPHPIRDSRTLQAKIGVAPRNHRCMVAEPTDFFALEPSWALTQGVRGVLRMWGAYPNR